MRGNSTGTSRISDDPLFSYKGWAALEDDCGPWSDRKEKGRPLDRPSYKQKSLTSHHRLPARYLAHPPRWSSTVLPVVSRSAYAASSGRGSPRCTGTTP